MSYQGTNKGITQCWTHSVVGAQGQKGEGHDRASVGMGKCWTHSVVGAQEQKGEGHDRTSVGTGSAGPTVWWGHRSKRAKGMTGPGP